MMEQGGIVKAPQRRGAIGHDVTNTEKNSNATQKWCCIRSSDVAQRRSEEEGWRERDPGHTQYTVAKLSNQQQGQRGG